MFRTKKTAFALLTLLLLSVALSIHLYLSLEWYKKRYYIFPHDSTIVSDAIARLAIEEHTDEETILNMHAPYVFFMVDRRCVVVSPLYGVEGPAKLYCYSRFSDAFVGKQ